MEISQELLVVGVLINSVGVGGILKWLFTNEHERQNLVQDVIFIKNKLAEKGQKIDSLEKELISQATDHKLLAQEFGYIKMALEEIKTMLAKITK